MSKIHLIIDFMPLYYRYFFQIKRGTLQNLSYNGIDTTYLYYITKEIEESTKLVTKDRDNIVISICFDSKNNKRKEFDSSYKSNRDNELGNYDFDMIDNFIYPIFDKIYDSYKIDGYEADDLIVKLAKQTDGFDRVYVMSPDKDLAHLVNDKVSCIKSSTMNSNKYIVDLDSYVDILSGKMGAKVPYNSILLYLSTVGDTPDCIKGIKGFGKVAYNKLIASNPSFDYSELISKDKIADFLKSNFDGDKLEQALHSLELVYPLDVNIDFKNTNASREARMEVFKEYGFNSLLGDKIC
jgi:DNA-directed DNA polymerase